MAGDVDDGGCGGAFTEGVEEAAGGVGVVRIENHNMSFQSRDHAEEFTSGRVSVVRVSKNKGFGINGLLLEKAKGSGFRAYQNTVQHRSAPFSQRKCVLSCESTDNV